VKVTPTRLKDVLIVEPAVHGDERGFLLESWHQERYLASGIPAEFVQDNQSRSVQGSLRGLHYQLTRPQGKLVWVVAGEVFDVAVDLRKSSPTFGHWAGEVLSARNHRQLWIPPGFAHGFYVLSKSADLLYKCTESYRPDDDRALRWDDPELSIDWPLLKGRPPLLSPRDAAAPALQTAQIFP
jgi:dTDP-4-dehydrorhamnose 3,5-epimerase